MKKQILLTIGIPTYNGGKYIAQTLDSILMQNNVDFSSIEILISNNNSTDNTESIVKKYIQNNKSLFSYNKNDKNIGYDRNVDILFEKAKGKYIEVLGDDDFFNSDNSLSKILEIISSNDDYSVLLLNNRFLDITTNEISFDGEYIDDVICKNGDEFFYLSKWKSAPISNIVIQKQLWNHIDRSKYYDTFWIHIGVLVEVLSLDKKSYLLGSPIIDIRIKNNRWEDNFGNQYIAGLVHLMLLLEMKKYNYNEKTYQSFLKMRYKHNAIDILSIAPNKYSERLMAIKLNYNFFKNSIKFWVIFLPLLLVPSLVFRTMKKVYRLFR